MSREALLDGPTTEPEATAERVPTRRVGDPELIAMSDICNILADFGDEAQSRIVTYVTSRWASSPMIGD